MLISFPHANSAQEHLVPDAGAFADPDSYLLKIRHVFAEAFDDEVKFRSLVLASRRYEEFVVGVHVKGEQVEAFVLEPSSSIRLSDDLESCQNAIKSYEEDGEDVPPDLFQRLKELKEDRKAVDYRTIKANRLARPLPKGIAEEIRSVWEEMLLDVRYPKEPIRGLDGVTYHFSAWLEGRGEISGHVWSPEIGSKTRSLTSLARVLGNYARGKAELSKLKEALVAAQAFTNH